MLLGVTVKYLYVAFENHCINVPYLTLEEREAMLYVDQKRIFRITL